MGTLIISYAFQLLCVVPYVDTGNPLLKNVGSISGGSGCIIDKQNKHGTEVMTGKQGHDRNLYHDPEGQGQLSLMPASGDFKTLQRQIR